MTGRRLGLEPVVAVVGAHLSGAAGEARPRMRQRPRALATGGLRGLLLRRWRRALLLVVGGYNSSNTTHLLEIGLANRIPTFHVQDASRLADAALIRHQRLGERAETETTGWLPGGALSIGLTAGASTPNAELERVVRRLAEIRRVSVDAPPAI